MKKVFLTHLSLPMSLSIAFAKAPTQFFKNKRAFCILFLFLLSFAPVFAQKQTVKVNLGDSSVIMLKDVTLMRKYEGEKTTYYYKFVSINLIVYAVQEFRNGEQTLLYHNIAIPNIRETPDLADVSTDKPLYAVSIIGEKSDSFSFVDIRSPEGMMGGNRQTNTFYFNDKALGEQFVATLRKEIEIYKK